jgi:PAS domain S-box-containing protein
MAQDEEDLLSVPRFSGPEQNLSRKTRQPWHTVCLLVAMLLLLCAFTHAFAGEIPLVIVDDSKHEWWLSAKAQYLVDESGTVTLEDIRAGRHDDSFKKIENEQANFGFQQAVFWLRFNLSYKPKNPQGVKPWWLSFNYPLLDYVDAYYVDPKGRPVKFTGGDQRPFSNNAFEFPRTTFGLELVPGATIPVLIRVENQGSQQLAFSLLSTKGIVDHVSAARLIGGIFVGIMVIMAFYNLFIFLSVRDIAYLYYVLAISVFIAGQLTLTGVTWQYGRFTDLTWNNTFISLALNIAWMFLILFSRAFLQTRERAPVMDAILKLIALACLWQAILSLFTDYGFSVLLTTRMIFFYALITTLIGVALWRRGHDSARYYTLAWVGYLIGVLSALLYLFGVLPFNLFTANGVQIGGFALVLMLSLGLADRINLQKKETESARRKALAAREEALEANKRAVSNLQKFRRLYENASEGIFQCTLDGRFLSANPSLANVFGYQTADELIENISNVGVQCYQNPVSREEFERTVLDHGRIIAHESVYLRRDGSHFWGSSSAHLVKNAKGKPICIEGSLIDITERMEKEKAQRERQAAEASASSKSEFLANMSHEIRTPMNAIVGFAALAQKTGLDPKQRDYLSKIEKSSKALLGIINDILDFSKIEAGKMSLDLVSFNLYDVLNDIINILSQKAADKNLELVVRISPDITPNLIGDPLRLEQVMINLINNALKFTAEGEVVIHISELQCLADTTQLQFEIIDTGIGITPEQKQKLFTPFTQADGSTTRKYGGTGLGLSISKQLVELMSGEIWVDSIPGTGSTFAFKAWFSRQTETGHHNIYAVKELQELQILVIDDHDAGQETLLEILASFHCIATAIQPDYTLIHKLEKDYPRPAFDLIIVDRQLRAIESMDAARKIHNMAAFGKIPILFMTLTNEQHLHEEARAQGLHLLIKPVTPSVLLDAMQSVLGFTGSKPAQESPEASEVKLARLKGHKVLLVEDTLFNQEIATEFLQQAGLQVSLAENGQEALEALKNHEFDAVLMDVQMPVMDGFEATRQIRLQSKFQQLPIIAMTANAMKGDKNRCLQAGMNDYISKPVSQDLLYQALLRWIAPQDEADLPALSAESVPQTTPPVPASSALPEDTGSPAVAAVPVIAVAPSVADIHSDADSVPLNLEKALLQMGGSAGLLKKMLNRFATEQAQAVDRIIEAYDAGDNTTAHRLAHTLKGIAGSLCANDLREAAASLESALETSSVPTQLEKLFSRADAELARVIGYLRTQQEA